jgi:acetyl-CoA acetyltransferase
MVASWCKSSKTNVEEVMRLRGEPFFTRPFGLNMAIADALFAQSVAEEFGIGEREVNDRVLRSYERAARNPRGMRFAVPDADTLRRSTFEATPLRTAQRAGLTDGAVCMVVASERWLRRHPSRKPLARIAGVGWSTDSYRLGSDRLRCMNSARVAWRNAWRMVGEATPAPLDLIELESQTGYHEAAYVRAFDLAAETALSPSGGPFAQNPLFCTGLVGAAEAVLQTCGRAGAPQVANVRRAAAHSCHGYAQQGNVVMIFENVEAAVV